jgi:hypothetical protein
MDKEIRAIKEDAISGGYVSELDKSGIQRQRQG